MYFKRLTTFIICLFWLQPLKVWAAKVELQPLTIQPNKCVALRKGRTCYADIKIKWQAQTTGNYCLLSNASSKPIACWHNKKRGVIDYNFESATSQEFSLVLENSNELVYSHTVVVTWLHKSPNRRRRWRLF